MKKLNCLFHASADHSYEGLTPEHVKQLLADLDGALLGRGDRVHAETLRDDDDIRSAVASHISAPEAHAQFVRMLGADRD